MYKKPVQPPTPIVNSKKPNRVADRVQNSSIDKKNETNSQFKNKDEQLLTMVKEYLQLNGYVRTHEILKNEKPNLKAKLQYNQAPKNELNKNQLLQLFDKGYREEFFKATSKYFANADQLTKKTEFELSIYFFIYSIHPNLKRQQNIDRVQRDAFKKYLDTKGSDLSGTSEFLSYFALPFMNRPQDQSGMAHLLTKQWINKLRTKLIQLITCFKNSGNFSQNSASLKKISTLQEIFYSNGSSSSQRFECKQNCKHSIQTQSIKQQNIDLRSVIDNYQKKFQEFAESSKVNLIESNQKWFYFARQLFLLAKANIKEEKVKLIQKYNSFFIGNIEEHIEGTNEISLFQKNSFFNDISITPDLSKHKIALNRQETVNQNYQIDLLKIKKLFLQSNVKEKQLEIATVLRALKCRFTKKNFRLQRRQIIVEYSRGDICGVNPENYNVQKRLFEGGQKIKLLYLKLMEIITIDAYGLQYLTKSDKLIQNLVDIFSQEGEQSRCRKPVLGILQRFSFSKQPRMAMIKLGIIPMIFNIFKNEGHEMSTFTIQFLIAMMMNLSLKKQSYPDFQQHKTELIIIFIDQMTSPNDHIRNYVNGTIFLLLTSKEIKKEALKQKLDDVIRKLIDSREDDMCIQQYNYILNRLNGCQNEELCQDTDADSNDQEEEAEIQEFDQQEEYDSLSQSSSQDYLEGDLEIANGEELLMKNYALLGPEAVRQQILNRSVLDETSKRLNNMTTSINRSRRMDNIFVQKGNITVLQPQLDSLLNRKK